jgi:hypothetical protein
VTDSTGKVTYVVQTGGHGLEWSGNICTWGGPYGAVLGNTTQGSASLALFSPGYIWGAGNVIIGLPTAMRGNYPAGTTFADFVSGVFDAAFLRLPGFAAGVDGAWAGALRARVVVP